MKISVFNPFFNARAFARIVCVTTCTTICASSTLAQSASPALPISGLRPVDAGRADVGPTSVSFRQIQTDFRRPLDFEQVFELASGRFARKSGAVTAVFPRSSYVLRGDGSVGAAVPADTRFVIGRAIEPVAPSRAAPSANIAPLAVSTGATTAADRRADHRVARGTFAMPRPALPLAVGATVAPRGMLTSEAYRVNRIGELLADAAGPAH